MKKKNKVLLMAIIICLVTIATPTKAYAKFWGWEKEPVIVAAYEDGTICERFNYYVLWIKVDSEVRCRPCC
ncbi:hypothetical protein [Rhodoflexus sp.]